MPRYVVFTYISERFERVTKLGAHFSILKSLQPTSSVSILLRQPILVISLSEFLVSSHEVQTEAQETS